MAKVFAIPYKEQTDSQGVKQKVEQILARGHQQYKTHSSQMRGYLRHFQNTYENWSPNLFTCYDYPDIPNDNNRLELSHSQMKKQYRRITGQISTSKYLKIHGEQAAFTLNFAAANNTRQLVEDVLRQTDYQEFKQQKKIQKQKSKMRGKIAATKLNLNKTLAKIKDAWGKVSGNKG